MCNDMFWTDFVDQIYCTDTCQRRGKYARRKERRMTKRGATEPIDDRIHAKVINPTNPQLFQLCDEIVQGQITKPIMLVGALPRGFIKPDGVDLVQPQGETTVWLLTKHEKSIFELLT